MNRKPDPEVIRKLARFRSPAVKRAQMIADYMREVQTHGRWDFPQESMPLTDYILCGLALGLLLVSLCILRLSL